MIIKLSKVITAGGKEIQELDLNLENLTGNDLIEAERRATRQGMIAAVVDVSKLYQAELAAIAGKIPVEEIRALPAHDFNNIVSAVQSFLLNSVLAESVPSEISA